MDCHQRQFQTVEDADLTFNLISVAFSRTASLSSFNSRWTICISMSADFFSSNTMPFQLQTIYFVYLSNNGDTTNCINPIWNSGQVSLGQKPMTYPKSLFMLILVTEFFHYFVRPFAVDLPRLRWIADIGSMQKKAEAP